MSQHSVARSGVGRGQKRRAGHANSPHPSQQPHAGPGLRLQPDSRYGYWTDAEQALLLHWLGLSGNFEKWKCIGIRNTDKKNRTSSIPKKSVAGLISEYLKEHHVLKTVDHVLNKMRYLEDKYKEVKDFLTSTCEGLSTDDEKMAISTIREKVYQKCPFFDTINPIMKDSVSITPPYVGESGHVENISDMLFNDSTLRGDFESLDEDDDVQDNGPDDEVQGDGSDQNEGSGTPISQTTGLGQSSHQAAQSPQEPQHFSPQHLPQSLQHCAEGAQHSPQPPQQPAQSLERPRASGPNLSPNITRINKKQKSIGEQVAELQKESRMMLEKKLEVTAEHRREQLQFQREESRQQLQFQREESERRFILENRRMDLEKEKLEFRRLTLQLELERIRCST